jgi:hypothetical protein
MPTNNQRVALLRQTTKGREDISILSFLFATKIRPGWQPSAVSQNKQASKHND